MLRDKLAGCIIGLAVGDSLGVPHEFKSQKDNIYTGLLYIAPTFTFRNGSWTDVVGAYSDDTEASLTIIRNIIKNGSYNKDNMILAYENWAQNAKLMGKNTRALFKGVKTVSGYQRRYNKIFGVPQDQWTQSNGSLMRAAPLAFLTDPSAIIGDCTITNPHPINIQCNSLYCWMIKWSAANVPKQTTIDAILKHNDILPEIVNVIKEAISDLPGNENIRNLKAVGKGWVLHALYCAVWGWWHFNNYQDAIDSIILRGGDTDTNAAIAGALIGATLGYDRLVLENRTSQNIKIVREIDFTKGDNPRSPDLSLGDFDSMIDKFLISPGVLSRME